MGSYLSKPDFIIVLADKQVKLGDDVTLRCEANTAGLTGTWQKDGEPLYCVDGKHFMKQNNKEFILEIKNAEDGDEGKYTLNLKNRGETASCSATVTVEVREWREMQWNQNEMISTLQAFKISHDGVKKLNFFLYGPVGAGKSSTINTIRTIFEKHLCVDFLAASGSSKSHTLSNEKCVFGKDGKPPLAFHDFKGIETENQGVHNDDVISALKGHMKEGYMFKPMIQLAKDNEYYRKNPSLSDQVHCLVNVLPADKTEMMNEFFNKMKPVREEASRMGIPQVVFMTRVDLNCKMTKKNLRYIYKRKKINDKMYRCSAELGIPVNCIFPVWNYHVETDLKEDLHCLMLYALMKIVHFADDYVHKYSNKKILEA